MFCLPLYKIVLRKIYYFCIIALMNKPEKLIVILGQTASGKSGLAVWLARQLAGEVISADSRQVYKGMNIGTGKVTKKEMAGIPHHCLSVTSPKKVYTASDFEKCAEGAMEKIWAKNKVPIVCGGTGFYIDLLLGKIQTADVPPNPKLRKELGKKSTEQLFKMLQKLDPERAKNIDAKNPRRLIRAIEIVKYKTNSNELASFDSRVGVGVHSWVKTRGGQITQATPYEVLQIGIAWPKEKLKERIAQRTATMVKQGVIKETKKLKESGVTWKRIGELGFEYKYPALFLRGKITKKEMLERMILESEQYAKRQTTWFKRDKNIVLVKPTELKKTQGIARVFLAK